MGNPQPSPYGTERFYGEGSETIESPSKDG